MDPTALDDVDTTLVVVQFAIVEVRIAKPAGLDATPMKKTAIPTMESAPIIIVEIVHSLLLLSERLHARSVGKKIMELTSDEPK